MHVETGSAGGCVRHSAGRGVKQLQHEGRGEDKEHQMGRRWKWWRWAVVVEVVVMEMEEVKTWVCGHLYSILSAACML